MFEGKPYFYGTGRRKKSIARVRLYPGTGVVTVNGRSIDEYFGLETLKVINLIYKSAKEGIHVKNDKLEA